MAQVVFIWKNSKDLRRLGRFQVAQNLAARLDLANSDLHHPALLLARTKIFGELRKRNVCPAAFVGSRRLGGWG